MAKKRGKRTKKSTSKSKTKSKTPSKKGKKSTKKGKAKESKDSTTKNLKSVSKLKPIKHRKKYAEKDPSKKLWFYHITGKEHIRKPNNGIRLVVGYTSVLALLYLIYFIMGMIEPSLSVLRADNSIIIDVVMLAWVFGVVYGFHGRKPWAWKLSIGWYAFMLLYSIIIMRFIRQGTYNISIELFTIAILSAILINLFVIWYIYKKKDYFTGKDHAKHCNKEDKIFIYTIICFWVMLLAISASVGMNFYSDTKTMTNNLMTELNEVVPVSGFEGGAKMCNMKAQPERDVCYVILTTMADGKNDYCNKVESQIYKYTCLQATR